MAVSAVTKTSVLDGNKVVITTVEEIPIKVYRDRRKDLKLQKSKLQAQIDDICSVLQEGE
jgi:hypothetical protein